MSTKTRTRKRAGTGGRVSDLTAKASSAVTGGDAVSDAVANMNRAVEQMKLLDATLKTINDMNNNAIRNAKV